MDLTLEDAGSRQTVSVGETVRVQLPETATTGYLWRPEVDGDALELVSDDLAAPAEPRGAGGWHVFTFRARRPGPTSLGLVQGRPWERTHIGEFRVDLDVRA